MALAAILVVYKVMSPETAQVPFPALDAVSAPLEAAMVVDLFLEVDSVVPARRIALDVADLTTIRTFSCVLSLISSSFAGFESYICEFDQPLTDCATLAGTAKHRL